MKKLPKFGEINEYSQPLNETMWLADVIEPFDARDEKSFASGFKVVYEPITVQSVTGLIDEDKTDVTIIMSNGDIITYKAGFSADSGVVSMDVDGVQVSDKSARFNDYYVGSTGTLVGDLLIMYRDMVLGKAQK
jgi:hypothetical protein